MIKVSVDQGVNLPKLKALESKGIVALHQVHDLEQRFREVQPQGRAAMYGKSRYGGPDMHADEKFKEVLGIMGPDKVNDAHHIYAAYLNGNEYFLTENPDDFINGGKRESLEKILGVKIRRTEEFLTEIEQGQNTKCN